MNKHQYEVIRGLYLYSKMEICMGISLLSNPLTLKNGV